MQSRLESAVEAKLNILIGFGLGWAINYFALPWILGIPANGTQTFWLTIFFSAVSFIRQYFIRRIFNSQFWKGNPCS